MVKKLRLFDLKTKKIKDLANELMYQTKRITSKDATMVGHGFTITYAHAR